MFHRQPSYESVKFHGKPLREEISLFKSLNLKVMKGILQTFVFLLFLTGAESLWGQCSIGTPTVTGLSCQNQSTDSPADDAIQFNLNVSATSGSLQGYWIDVSGGTTVTPQEGTYGSTLAITLGNGTAGSSQSYTLTLTDKSDLSCQRTVVVGPQASCSAGCSTPVQFICDNPANAGPHTVTLTATGGLTNVLWFNEANVQVGAGSLVVSVSTPGMVDGTEEFYYTALDGTGCVVSLCCPITVQTQDCGYIDLALIKQKSDNLPVSYGQTITFNIQVCNQGTDPVTSVSLIDYIPSGFTLNDGSWSLSGTNAIRTLTAGGGIIPAGGIPVSGCITVPINLTVNNTANSTNVLNIAEITAGTDSEGRTDDVDSTPDSTPGNDPGGLIGSPADNYLNGDGTGTVGSGVAASDEDDQDPATVRIVDLALKKEIVTAGPYSYGQPITFRITIVNQGNETATSIAVSDYVPAGFSFAPNNGWSGTAPLISRTIAGPLNPGFSTSFDLVLTLQQSTAPNAWLNVAEISAFNDVNGYAIGMFDIDSEPDQSPNNDAGGLAESPADNYLDGNGTGPIGGGVAATDEDDQDPALVNIFDLALTKVLNTTAPYTYGQVHNFTITVYNQGNVTATNIVLSDYIPAGYTFVANNGWTGAAPTITKTIAGPLAPGASTTVNLDLTFVQVGTTTAKSWINYTEITSAQDGTGSPATDVDSTPGSNGTNENNILPGKTGDDDITSTSDTGVGSQDDHDPAGPWIFDLATIITNNTDVITSYGENVSFPIVVENQGNISSQGYTLTVMVPSGFDFGTNPSWSYNAGTGMATYTTTDIINPGETDNLSIVLVSKPATGSTAWTVKVEISDDTPIADEVGIKDIDSTPDLIFTNDAGGAPIPDSEGGSFPGSDDTLDGNGTGTPGSTVAATDEDDEDPEFVQLFDLALTKVLNTTAPYTYGQVHNFTITVHNQGNITATNIVVSDYIPAGYTFVANNGWTGAAPTITKTIAGPLAPGASTTVNLDLTFVSLTSPTAKSWINYAEVTSAQDASGNPVYDVDSTPGSNGTNENNVYPNGAGDNDITSTSDTGVGSQDDHDPAGPKVFDLALRKTKVTATPSFSYGQTVMYQIEIFNQGNIAATGIEVTDYLPCGLEFNALSATNVGWSLSGSKVTKTYTGTLNPGQSTILNIDLIVRECYTNQNTAWTNYAEISKADDTDPTTSVLPVDIDSTPDGTNGNDTGGVPDFGGVSSGTDDTINNENGDEDDHDPVKIEIFDLALRKVLATPAPYTYGQALTFNVEVFNQGNVTAQNIVISDYIPSGYTFVANNGWTGGPSVINRTFAGPLAPGASTGSLPLVLTLIMDGTGDDAWDNYAEVSSSMDNNNNNRNDDADSVLDNNPNNDNDVNPGDADDNNILGGGPNANPDEDEDDHDPAAPVIVDIALRKTTVTPGPYNYGDVVSFNIEVINQGNVDLTDIDIVDYIPCGFEYSSGSQTWTLNGTQAQTNLAGILTAGSSTTIRIDLKVIACSSPNAWLNYAEVRNMEDTQGNNLSGSDIDSNPDNTNGNDDGGLADSANDDFVNGNGKAAGGSPLDAGTTTDEDDHDPELIQVFDLALRKTLTTAGPYRYGDNLTFTIEVFNQGNIAAHNVVINDYIPAGYTFVGALNPTWSGAAPLVTKTIAGPIAPASSVTTTIVLTLARGSGDATWDNYAEVNTATDSNGNPVVDADSTPDNNPTNDNPVKPGDPDDNNITGGGPSEGEDEDDHDPAAPALVDVALRKTNITAGPYTYGQVVSFNIDVINQGNVEVTDIAVVDYLPCGFEYVSGSQPWAVSGTQATAMLSGSLVPGQTRTIRIDLKVIACTSPNAWLNYAEVKSFEDVNGNDISAQDIDSTPDNNNLNDDGGLADSPNDDYVDGDGKLAGGTPRDSGLTTDEDDHDPELIPVFDLALKKVLVTGGPYTDGQPLTFNITVYNQGNQTAQSIVINDYVPIGYTYNAALNPGWAGSLPNLTYNVPGTLAPGASVTIPVVLNIEMTMGGSRNWINYSEIGSADNDSNPTNTPPTDADSTPSSNTPQENTVVPGDSNDDNVNGGGPSEGEDEDDHDPAGPRLYDVALAKTTTAVGPFSFGQVVKFDIAVINQGNFPVRNIKVADYIPAGFKYRGAENFGVWTYDAFSGNATTTVATTLLPGQSTSVSIYLEVQPTTNYVTGWDNRAEIYSFEDTNGNNVSSMDIDSSPDTNPNNDAGGEPEGPSDDYTGGDGNGPIGGGPASGDEDDADPERIEIFDLALRKELVTAGPYAYGDLLEYNITVFNQGNEAATNVQITDYIPAGYTFSLADNAGWVGAAPSPTYVIAGPILPAASQTVKVYLRIQQTTGGEKYWINYAEITHASDADGNSRDTWDIDSNPGSNGTAENAVEPGKTGDNVIDGHDKGGEEDDHDPAGIEIFDLAVYMTDNTVVLNNYGDDVTFTINVTNQGSITSNGFTLTDYMPSGYVFNASDNPGWVLGAGGKLTFVSSEVLVPGETVIYTLILEAKPTKEVDGWVNYVEISDDNSVDPVVTTDIDSAPDATKTNDAGGKVETTSDDIVTGIGVDRNRVVRDVYGSTNPLTDEDDHDPETIIVYDMALYKKLVTAGPYKYGQQVQFDVCVVNQGSETMQNVDLKDYIPAGYAFNAANNPGWTLTGTVATRTIAGPVLRCDTICVPLILTIQQTTGGEKNWINYAEITEMETTNGTPVDDVDSNPNSNGPEETAVEPGDPADDNTTSIDEGGEEDDHDPAGIEVFDLAQRKVIANQTGPYQYGNQLTYTIELFNQGSISAGNIEVTDFIPCGFKYLASNDANGWSYNATTGMAKKVVAGPLVPGATTFVTITLELKQCLDNSVGSFTNYTEISDADSNDPNEPPTDIDSTPDTNPGNDPGGEPDGPNDDVVTEDPNLPGNDDEDDHDPERIEIFDLALKKELVTAGPYHYGQILDFNITVCNQGNVNAANIVVSDYLPAGYGFTFANNAGWTGTVTAPTYAVPGTLVQDQCTVIPMKLTILQTTGGEKNWVNYAEITSATDSNGGPRVDADSNPGSNNPTENGVEPGDAADNNLASTDKGGEEDDHDPAGIEIYDLAQRKVTTATGPFRYGDIVKFTYEVYNQGSIQASGIELTDYIPCGYKYVAASNNALGWSYNSTTGNATVIMPGSLVPGAFRTIDIYLQVKPCIASSTDAWTNIAEISDGNSDDPNEPPTDIDSDPDKDPDNDPGGEPDGPNDDVVDEDPNLPGDDDEDDHDPERIEIVDLALRKTMVTAGPYRYGQIIDFDIEIFNQGNVTMTDIEVIDYIPEGFTYDPAINQIWQGTYPAVFTIVSGPLAPEASTKVRLKLKLVQTSGGSSVYYNGSEITGMQDDNGDPRDDDDADSTPDVDPDNDNPVTPGDDNDDEVDESPNDPDTNDDDEDDSDPAGPKIFDLALRKVQLTATPSFSYGQTVMFGIQLFNQGNVDAKDIVIVDTLPCGLEFLPTSAVNIAAGWVYNPVTREVRTTYRNILAAGTSAQLSLDNKVVPCYSSVGKAWTNWAEIESANDNDPNTPNPPVDIDSDPDNNNNNDEGGQPNTPEDDEINGDPNNPDNPSAPQDEDDHDPHQIEVFDLAIRKTVDNRGPYRIGETATFRLKVFNQGNVPAKNIKLNDYLRSGFSFNPAANAGWTLTTPATPSVNGLLNYTVPTLLNPGDSIVVTLKLEIALDANPAVTDWWNYAEIRTAQDTLGNNRYDDADSTPNSNSPYENDVEPDDAWDNVVNGNGPNFNQDEDDHDPEKVIVVGGLGDTVWKDIDGDGIQDPGEPGVANVIATLTDCRGNVLATDVTDANGFYFFDNLIPGDYQVQFNISNLPQGCAFTFQNQGSSDKLDSDVDLTGLGPCTNITGGEYDSTYDAGLLILAAIGDYVWHDLNADGQQGFGEPAIPGVQVNLYKGDGTYVGTTYTDINGKYLFDFLYPGNYYLEFINPTGFDRTFPNIGNDVSDSDSDDTNGPRTTATTYLAPGERDMTWDAGYYKCVPIGDLVWYDINKNDIWDTNENGINALTVNLWRNHFGTWLIWDHVRTGHKPNTPSDDGYFKFCAPPGQYYIEVELPPLGLVRARANVGSNEEIDSDITNANGAVTSDKFTVTSGQEKCDLGAGFYPQATAGNLVWVDSNANGVQESAESRMADVIVQAISVETGEVTSQAVTDAEGTYLLDGLEKQAYYLKFTPPAGYYATVARATTDDKDSDVDHSFGSNTTRAFDMQPANAYENIDMGLAFSPLPVNWLDVRAERVNNTHLISWSVTRESNVSHYEVERRLNKEVEFYTIPGKVMAKGNVAQVLDYNLTDFEVEKSGVYIYRVKQYDFDGKSSYSKLVKVSHNGENSIEIYPNPARNETSIQLVLAQDSDVKVEMFDAAAKLIQVIKPSGIQKAGDVSYNTNLQDIPAGVYNVIITIDGVQTQKKLIRIE